jgi:hypothetical protein
MNNLTNSCPCGLSNSFISIEKFQQCLTCGRGNTTLAYGKQEAIDYLESLPNIYQDLTLKTDEGELFIPYFNDLGTHLVFLNQDQDEPIYQIIKKSDLGKETIPSEKFKFEDFSRLYLRINEILTETDKND